MSTINSKNVQVGTSGVAAQNFTLYQPATPDGTVRLGVGNSGATTGDVVTVTSAGNVTVSGVLAATTLSGAVTGGAVSGTTGSFSGNLSFNSGYGSAAVAYGCRAWVNFTSAGTVTIRASGNVTSITDNGVGDFTVNFTNALPDANYSMGAAGEIAAGTNYNVIQFNQNTAPTTSAVRLTSLNQSGGVPAVFDSARVTISIFR